MGAVAAVKYGDESASRMHGDVDWKVAQLDLLANGTQRPLIGQQNRAVWLFAGKSRLRAVALWCTLISHQGWNGSHTTEGQDNRKRGHYKKGAHKTGSHVGLKIEKCKLKNANCQSIIKRRARCPGRQSRNQTGARTFLSAAMLVCTTALKLSTNICMLPLAADKNVRA